MCKFTNRLFVFIVLFHVAVSKPMRPARLAGEISPRRSDLLEFLYDDYNDYGFQEEQIHYDQRQKGEENLRVRLDGFFIEFPTLDDPYSLDVLAEQYISKLY
ncbi:uncharacterized protein LOC115626079 [Scaptodrosophila lebanonensis]|uniref:Uncharacterized protein LOC115626079 n=1 Tax=Drosophila lebanonensis TaxID=7225 RepID=A0A6J2TQG2_DROLE|nr:uncharacterized protein LOC115626079 [Scaptodrosophila lebanonensis]